LRRARSPAGEPRVHVPVRQRRPGRAGRAAGRARPQPRRDADQRRPVPARSLPAIAARRPVQPRRDPHEPERLGSAARGQSLRSPLRPPGDSARRLSRGRGERDGAAGTGPRHRAIRSERAFTSAAASELSRAVPMRILSITAGAANMYCGSCLRDNALAAELLRRGHDVTLLPVYTPTRTDESNVSAQRVLFGGISVYLQQHAWIFRHTPRVLDRLWDAAPVIRAFAGRSM